MSDLLIDIAAVAIGCVTALGLLLHLRRRQARCVERRSRPAVLRDAELIHIEKTVRMTRPVAITAKLDRAFCFTTFHNQQVRVLEAASKT